MVAKLFNREVIMWAIKRTRLPIDTLAKKLGIKETSIQAWEAGTAEPSIAQAKKLANVARLPFPMLLLDSIPNLLCNLPDFRSSERKMATDISLDLEETIDNVRSCQSWYRDYLESFDAPKNTFVGCIREIDTPEKAANIIKQHIDINEIRKKAKNKEDFLSLLIHSVETQLGICVMRSGHVKNATKRSLDSAEFRGFALSDDLAPFIFLNTNDAIAGQVFTLIHELTHIARNLSGISSIAVESAEEIFANNVASLLLIPTQALSEITAHKDSLLEAARGIADKLLVSSWAVLTRSLKLKLISQKEYTQAVAQIEKNIAQAKQKPKEKKGGPSFFTLKKNALGQNVSTAIINAVQSGALLYRDMWAMAGIKPSSFGAFKKYVEARLI